MKLKKLIIVALVITILALQFNFIQFINHSYAENEQTSQQINSEKFHYKQLTTEAQAIYNGIYEMYINGILKTGTESYDLAQHGYITQEQLKKHSNGDTTLTTAMNAARYAFYADYPEVFYVNFPKLNLRITKDAQNIYHANIGRGNYLNYYTEGFTSKEQVENAIIEFNNVVDDIAQKAKEINVEQGKLLKVEQIKYVHNEITKNTSYRLESDCTPGNEGFLGTPYGALVQQQAVCEGYARAFKTILDKLEINSILVQGLHKADDGSAAIEHMWTYVEIEEETNSRAIQKVWYAVDVTLDDPFIRKVIINTDNPNPDKKPGDDIVEGFENTQYCLVGAETMSREHTLIDNVEAAGNYHFDYPELCVDDYSADKVADTNGLVVKYKEDGTQTEEYTAGDYFVSYNNKGYTKAAEEGKYILMKAYYYRPADDEWDIGKWGYLIPGVYMGGFSESETQIHVTIPNSEYVQFAVTTLAPGDYESDPKYLSYQGDESDFVAQTEKLYNPSGTFKSRPYIKEQSPAATANLTVGPNYHIRVVYDDDLELEEGATSIGYRLESTGSTGAEKSEITNFNWDGKRKVEFNLKFSEMFADDGATYTIYITGVVGKNSKKAPMEISYGAVNEIMCAFNMNKAKNWEVFARPSLLENEDLSMNDWQTSDGTPVSDKLKSRIALVTTKTTTEQKKVMNELMEEELQDQEIVTSQTYNISLNVCRKYVVKTGHRLRLSLGFPAGYGPEDEGVTFKAYHFKRNSNNEIIGVEEIPCVVTKYGLIVTCDSFSPFAIAVVENDGTTNSTKYAIASASEGGIIEGANREEGNIFALAENEQKTIKVKADENYEIETITLFGEVMDMTNVENKDELDITIKGSDIKVGNGIINATFVAKEVVQEEKENEETPILPQDASIEVKLPQTQNATVNKEVKIVPTITPETETQTYQWYKNGDILQGKTDKVLSLTPTSLEDSGVYTLKVTTVIDTISKETISSPCNLVVRVFNLSITSKDETNALEKGKEYELTVSTNEFVNINEGLIALLGKVEYDNKVLENVQIIGQNGWGTDEDSINSDNFKFIIDSSEIIKEHGEIFKIKFKVKENLTKDLTTTLKITGISASGGEGEITANDVQINLGIKIPEEDKFLSDKYIINEQDKDISRILPKTTLKQLKENIETNLDIVVTNKQGNALKDEDIIGTGMKLKAGENLEFTLVVTGDSDGDGEVGATELAKIKLDLIDIKKVSGIELKALDIDNNSEISTNDLAKVKLVIIGIASIK